MVKGIVHTAHRPLALFVHKLEKSFWSDYRFYSAGNFGFKIVKFRTTSRFGIGKLVAQKLYKL